MVVGLHIARGVYQNPILAAEWLFAVVVEEKRDVREFFGFGAAQLRKPLGAYVFPENIYHFRRLGEEDVGAKADFVFSHRDKKYLWPCGTLKAVEVLVDERACQFARAVAAEVEKYYGVAVFYPAYRLSVLDNPSRDYEFVANHIGLRGFFVILSEGVFGLFNGGFGFCADYAVVGFFDSVPPLVSVHRPEAPYYRCDLSGSVFLHFAFDFADKSEAACGRRVASVGKGVQINFVVFFIGANFEDRVQVP